MDESERREYEWLTDTIGIDKKLISRKTGREGGSSCIYKCGGDRSKVAG